MIFISAIHRAVLYGMFVAIMAFFARISDPAVGGTFMTFLNTLTNLGQMWPSSFSLWFVDIITNKECQPVSPSHNQTISLTSTDSTCKGTAEVDACEAAGMSCHTITEGYYILSIACCCVGYLWLAWGWRAIRQLQRVETSRWRVVGTSREQQQGDKEETFKYFYCLWNIKQHQHLSSDLCCSFCDLK